MVCLGAPKSHSGEAVFLHPYSNSTYLPCLVRTLLSADYCPFKKGSRESCRTRTSFAALRLSVSSSCAATSFQSYIRHIKVTRPRIGVLFLNAFRVVACYIVDLMVPEIRFIVLFSCLSTSPVWQLVNHTGAEHLATDNTKARDDIRNLVAVAACDSAQFLDYIISCYYFCSGVLQVFSICACAV